MSDPFDQYLCKKDQELFTQKCVTSQYFSFKSNMSNANISVPCLRAIGGHLIYSFYYHFGKVISVRSSLGLL